MIPDDVAARYRASGAWTAETLPHAFLRTSLTRGDAVALIDGARRLAFRECWALAQRVAAHLAARGVRRGDVVSWQLPNWWEAAILHHAILLAGAIPNPLNPALRERELAFVAREAEPRLAVVAHSWRGFDADAAARALGVDTFALRGGDADAWFADDPRAAAPDPAPGGEDAREDDIALLLYTSGTTADPKGVQLSHRALLCEIRSFADIHRLTPADRYLGGAPMAHIAGLVYGALTPFVLGTSTVLLERWDAARALDAVARERATFMTGPPTFLQTLADAHTGQDTSSFRLFSTGGASIPTDAVRRAGETLGCVVKRAYGSSEVPTLTATRFDDDDGARIATDGRVVGDAEMRIVRDDGTGARADEEGEIWARAPEMFDGYRGGDGSEFEPGGWFRTGDLGSVDARGYLRVTGRLKDIIIRGGENISAKEIEDALMLHPDIDDVAVVGIPDERLGERVCAFVVARAGAAAVPGVESVARFLAAQDLSKSKFPERVEARTALPRTESGKVKKNELRAELARAPRAADTSAPWMPKN
jgi:cyclohexanecarboxylate-CoA ligase